MSKTSRSKRIGAGGLTVGATLALAAATAWACVSGPAVSLSTTQAMAGEEVTVSGSNFRQAYPVVVRMDSLTGPVIATLAEPDSRNIGGTFTVPAATAPGNHVVIFSQVDETGQTVQMPIRSLLTVVGPEGTTPLVGASLGGQAAERPVGLVVADNSISGGTMMLIALGVGGVAMFMVGAAALLAGRRASTAPAAAKVRS